MTVGRLKQLIAHYNDNAEVVLYDITHDIRYYRSVGINMDQDIPNYRKEFKLNFEGSPNLKRMQL